MLDVVRYSVINFHGQRAIVATDNKTQVHIPEIAGSLKTLFILRTLIVFMLVVAGVACLYFGGNMLSMSLQGEAQSILFEVAGSFKITAGGFGAVVMTTSLVPFYFAYCSRPTIDLLPMSGNGYRIVSDGKSNDLDKINNSLIDIPNNSEAGTPDRTEKKIESRSAIGVSNLLGNPTVA